MPKQRPSWLVAVLLVVALVSTAGWVVSARRAAPTAGPEAAAAVQVGAHAGHVPAARGGAGALDVPAIAPRDGVLAMTVPPLPKDAVNFIWRPEHLRLAPGQQVTLKVANADYMQHNFTFKAAGVARNLPVDATTTIRLTAPSKPGVYRFFCKYHLQMMEGAVTVQ
jgi:plastocyanin